MIQEEADKLLEKEDPISLLKWLRNASEFKSIKFEKSSKEAIYWWTVSMEFDKAAYKIAELRK